MTPDRNEPDTNPQWQRTGTHSVGWDDSLDQFDDLPRQTNALEDEDLDFAADQSFDDEAASSDITPSLATSALSRGEVLKQIGLQISPILIPLLLGILTCLCTLPFVLNGHAYVSYSHFWPIGIIIIALAILQGMGLYYAGSNNGYWILTIAGGFCLFLLVGCFTLFGSLPSVILLLILLALGILGIRTSLRPVTEGTVGIVTSSGKYSRTLLPGLNFLLPWEKIEVTVNTREVQWQCPEQKLSISREEDVYLHATISYQLEPEDAHIAALEVEKWEDSLHEAFKAALQNVATGLTPDDFYVWTKGFRSRQHVYNQSPANETPRWDRINAMLYQRMSDRVAQWGVQINWVQVYDILLVPRIDPRQDTGNPSLQSTGQPPAGPATTASAKELKPMNPAQLINAYNSVKKGTITDPTTIQQIAARFSAIASDPEQSQKVEFDAGRAASNLYAKAKQIEDSMSQVGFNDDFNDITQPDWNMRRRAGDDL